MKLEYTVGDIFYIVKKIFPIGKKEYTEIDGEVWFKYTKEPSVKIVTYNVIGVASTTVDGDMGEDYGDDGDLIQYNCVVTQDGVARYGEVYSDEELSSYLLNSSKYPNADYNAYLFDKYEEAEIFALNIEVDIKKDRLKDAVPFVPELTPKSNVCGVCGIDFSNATNYVCLNLNCPVRVTT